MFFFTDNVFPHILVYPFVAAYLDRVVIGGSAFVDARSDVLRASLSLRDYGGIVHYYRYDQIADGDMELNVFAGRYAFHNDRPDGTPWGVRLPLQCRSCGCLHSWDALFVAEPEFLNATDPHALVYGCVGLRGACSQQVVVDREHYFQGAERVLTLPEGCWVWYPYVPGYHARVQFVDGSVRMND